MRFVLPLPPSVNAMYTTRPGKFGKTKSTAYRAWRKLAGKQITVQRVGQRLPPAPFLLDVWLYVPDDGRRRDASNFVKAPEDLLASTFGFDDNLVVDQSAHKRTMDGGSAVAVVYLLPSGTAGEEAWFARMTGKLERREVDEGGDDAGDGGGA